MQAKAEYYRNLAKRSREIAERIDDQDAKAHMLSVADQYDRLAEDAENKQ